MDELMQEIYRFIAINRILNILAFLLGGLAGYCLAKAFQKQSVTENARLRSQVDKVIGLFHMALRESGCTEEQIKDYDIHYALLDGQKE